MWLDECICIARKGLLLVIKQGLVCVHYDRGQWMEFNPTLNRFSSTMRNNGSQFPCRGFECLVRPAVCISYLMSGRFLSTERPHTDLSITRRERSREVTFVYLSASLLQLLYSLVYSMEYLF